MHTRKREALAARLREGAGPVGLAKDTSNLFRDRAGAARRRLDVRHFDQVLNIGNGFVDAEGMISYEALTRECLAHGVMPAVVPQLKTITLGGAVAGVGIESSSHRYGLVHDGMLDGANQNELTDTADRDPFTGIPHHRHVRCRLERFGDGGAGA